jgi:hypothetical protein
MALRVARGLFRLWLVLSVLWIGGVGVVTWWTFPNKSNPDEFFAKRNPPSSLPRKFDPDEFLSKGDPEYFAQVVAEEQRATIQFASVLALVPPIFLLALGSALVWAFRGFR